MTAKKHLGKIVVDLDGVLAGKKPESGYIDCEPNGQVVQRLRELKALGYTIAIHTSRNVRSLDNNLGRIIAETVPVITEWLQRHHVPCDELVPAKPWTGEVGFYVDDRAVNPQEFVELNVSELLARARGVFYDPSKPAWRAGTRQPWIVMDRRANPSTLLTEGIIDAIREARDAGRRTMLVIDANDRIPVGQDEELLRLGARWTRASAQVSIESLLPRIKRELILANDTCVDEDLEVYRPSPAQGLITLSSRHFNTVRAYQDRVVKSSQGGQKVKLDFELYWLEAISQAGRPNVVIGGVEPRSNDYGYVMERAAGGSLAQVLLRSDLTNADVAVIVGELERLWVELDQIVPGRIEHASNKLSPGKLNVEAEHLQLINVKSRARVTQLAHVLKNIDGLDVDRPWTVNGRKIGSVRDVVSWLLTLVPQQQQAHRGVWHGDLCPGNVVLTKSLAEDDVQCRLIDPRGTIDGETLALYGDRRYDLAKLAHALRWGYDALVAGWHDVSWTPGLSTEVHYRIWDEEGEPPARLKVWEALNPAVVRVGPTALNDPEVHALTALQLITCAALHRDDSKRVVALIARGMDVAAYAAQAILGSADLLATSS